MGTQRITRIGSGSTFEEMAAYSRAVVDGYYVHVAGTTGYDYATMTISADVVEQARQCFKNIEHALKQAGSDLTHIVRIRYILPDRSDFESCWPVLREYLSGVRPAATMIQAGLISEAMKIEIEATARLPD